jgi:Protein of unknown function (DUF433).
VTPNSYIVQRDGDYYIQDTRVSLASIVYAFLEGLSPESIQADCFPTLTLEQVYGAITYYLSHRAEVDAYLAQEDSEYEEFRAEIRTRYPHLGRRLDALRQSTEALSS